MIITGQSLCWVLTIELMWVFTCRNCLLFSTPRLLIALPSSLQPGIETLEVLKCDMMPGVSPLLLLLPPPPPPGSTPIQAPRQGNVSISSHSAPDPWTAAPLHSCQLVLLPSSKRSAPAPVSSALTSQGVSISFFSLLSPSYSWQILQDFEGKCWHL